MVSFKFLKFIYLFYLDSINQVIIKSSAGRERNEKRNSTGSAILPIVSLNNNTNSFLNKHLFIIVKIKERILIDRYHIVSFFFLLLSLIIPKNKDKYDLLIMVYRHKK
jgi:hypothetical protein